MFRQGNVLTIEADSPHAIDDGRGAGGERFEEATVSVPFQEIGDGDYLFTGVQTQGVGKIGEGCSRGMSSSESEAGITSDTRENRAVEGWRYDVPVFSIRR